MFEPIAHAVPTDPITIPVWIDLAAVVVGSFSGILYAHQRELDLVGYIGLAILCGLGGGLIRDTIMQVGDVYILRSPYPIAVSVLTAIGFFFLPHALVRHPNVLEWVDIVAVALFAAAGTDKAIVYELHGIAVVFMGTMTAVGGGMLRDVFLGDVPRIFQRSNLYATCAIAGSAAYLACTRLLYLDKLIALAVCMAVTIGLRRWSLHHDVYSLTDAELESHMERVLKKKK